MRRDDGSTLPLTIFFGALCLIIVLGVAAATSLYLERKRLFTLADGAALAGAEAFSLDELPAPHLTSPEVAHAVDSYLATAPAWKGLRVVRAESTDGRSATVTLAATWIPPVLDGMLPTGIPLGVTAVARSVFD